MSGPIIRGCYPPTRPALVAPAGSCTVEPARADALLMRGSLWIAPDLWKTQKRVSHKVVGREEHVHTLHRRPRPVPINRTKAKMSLPTNLRRTTRPTAVVAPLRGVYGLPGIGVHHRRNGRSSWPEYALRRHSRTQRRPLEHFQAEEQARLLPTPTTPYDIPLWSEPKVGRDQLAAVDKAVYSIPHPYVGQWLTARAEAPTVRFYARGLLIKTHSRKACGGQSIDASDYPV